MNYHVEFKLFNKNTFNSFFTPRLKLPDIDKPYIGIYIFDNDSLIFTTPAILIDNEFQFKIEHHQHELRHSKYMTYMEYLTSDKNMKLDVLKLLINNNYGKIVHFEKNDDDTYFLYNLILTELVLLMVT